MTVVDHRTGEIVETIGSAEARRLTTEAQNEFRSSADHFSRGWALIEEAVKGGGHVDLGYRSPGDYLHAEFDGVLAGLDVASRRIAVRTMTEWGLSTRAMAAPLKASVGTIHGDQVFNAEHLPSGESPDSPAPQTPAASSAGAAPAQPESPKAAPDEEGPTAAARTGLTDDSTAATPEAGTPASTRPPVVGRDGKTYAKSRSDKRATPRRALPDQFFTAAYDAVKKVESLHRLIGDDRFPQNAEKVAAKHRNDLLRIRDLLEQVINSLPEKESTHD